MFLFQRNKSELVPAGKALSGREKPIPTAHEHFVTGRKLTNDVPDGFEQAMFGMGCFWGVERIFWNFPGVWQTRVGYAAGQTPNPTYKEVCSGQTGHNEVVHVIYDPTVVTYEMLLKAFWENHDPTQGMRQGNDRGTQYRSGIYTYSEAQNATAEETRKSFSGELERSGYSMITTEILEAGPFFHAEDYHQQYLAKNPGGYCGLGGTGVSCPVGVGAQA